MNLSISQISNIIQLNMQLRDFGTLDANGDFSTTTEQISNLENCAQRSAKQILEVISKMSKDQYENWRNNAWMDCVGHLPTNSQSKKHTLQEKINVLSTIDSKIKNQVQSDLKDLNHDLNTYDKHAHVTIPDTTTVPPAPQVSAGDEALVRTYGTAERNYGRALVRATPYHDHLDARGEERDRTLTALLARLSERTPAGGGVVVPDDLRMSCDEADTGLFGAKAAFRAKAETFVRSLLATHPQAAPSAAPSQERR